MIGTLISLKYIGKQSWRISIQFWITYLILVALLCTGVLYVIPEKTLEIYVPIKIALLLIVFVLLSRMWLKMRFVRVLQLFVFALIIDTMIGLIIFFGFGGTQLFDDFVNWLPSMSLAQMIK